jgi:hypothetical protein
MVYFRPHQARQQAFGNSWSDAEVEIGSVGTPEKGSVRRGGIFGGCKGAVTQEDQEEEDLEVGKGARLVPNLPHLYVRAP